ncbi:MAG TPA: hypothetical protein EYO76_12790 [Flavobacteriaceae bacterium]|nr:hypothetical protein [Flavobacteriaceae bacterium]
MASQRLVTSTRGREIFKSEFQKYFGDSKPSDQNDGSKYESENLPTKKQLEDFILYLDGKKFFYFTIFFPLLLLIVEIICFFLKLFSS